MTKDPFTILGVPYDASRKEISSAYRRLAREHHPDVSNQESSISLMQEINWAYEILSEPEKRRSYYTKKHANGRNNRGAGNKSRSRGTASGDPEAASYPHPSIEILGGTADRAIIGAVAGLIVLGISVIIGVDFASAGALIALVIGVWIGSVPDARISSQNGIGIGGVIGLFYGAIVGLSIIESLESASIAGAILVCAPSMILVGATMGAVLGGLSAGLRKIKI